jgi:hypothetical protein
MFKRLTLTKENLWLKLRESSAVLGVGFSSWLVGSTETAEMDVFVEEGKASAWLSALMPDLHRSGATAEATFEGFATHIMATSRFRAMGWNEPPRRPECLQKP